MAASSETRSALSFRDAAADDLDVLTAMRAGEAIHRDRLRDADGIHLRYFVLQQGTELAGFGLLVFEQPDGWPEVKLLPKMIDLWVRPGVRSQGIGSFMIGEMEAIARQRGHEGLHVSVDPEENQRAFSLYVRLGYEPLQKEPYLEEWSFTSSDGQRHEGRALNIDLCKRL